MGIGLGISGIVTSILVGLVIYRKQKKADAAINEVITSQKKILDELHNRVINRKKYIIDRIKDRLSSLRQFYVNMKEYLSEFEDNKSPETFEEIIDNAEWGRELSDKYSKEMNTDLLEIKDYINNPRLSDRFELRIEIIGRAFKSYSRKDNPYYHNHIDKIHSGIDHAIKNIDSLISDLDEEIKEQSESNKE